MSNGVSLGDVPHKPTGFIPSPTANDPNARKNANQDNSGFIPSPTENSTGGVTGSWEPEGFWSKAWRRANTTPGFIEKHLLAPARKETGAIQKKTEADIAAGSPIKARFHSFEAGVDADIDKIASGFFTPISLGLSALSMAESLPWAVRATRAAKLFRGAAKTTQISAGTYFGTQAVGTLTTPKQPNESEADYLERQGMAGFQFAMSGAGTYGSLKDVTHTFLRTKLGMSEDLSSKVSANVAKIAQAKATEASRISTAQEELATKQRAIDTKTAQATLAVQQDLEHNISQLESQVAARISNINRTIDEQTSQLQGKLGSLENERVAAGKSLISATAQTVAQYEAQFRDRFNDIGEKVKGTISTADDIRSIIEEEAQNHGVQPKEIPASATVALPKPQSSEITVSGRPATDIEMARFREEGIIQPEGELDFNQLTRVKDDLYNSAYSHKDGAVRAALYRAAERVSDMQEAAAKKANLGPEYAKLKSDYMKFIRGVGSDTVRSWLSAEDMADQELSGKVSKLVTPASAPVLKSILNSVGIDTKGFDDIIEGIRTGKRTLRGIPAERAKALKSAQEGVPETLGREKETSKEETRRITAAAKEEAKAAKEQHKEAVAAARQQSKEEIESAEAPGQIIEGKSTSQLVKPEYALEEGNLKMRLVSKSNDELLRERLAIYAKKLKGMGYLHPWRLMIIAIGFSDIMSGLREGRLSEAGRGTAYAGAYMSPTVLPQVFKSSRFQDWMLRESGVEPTNKLLSRKIRLGIERAYPALRRAAQTQVPSATISLGQIPQKQEQQQ